MSYRCSKCKSTRVQIVEWTLPNTERVINGRRFVEIAPGEPFSDGDESFNWCEFCDDHTTLEEVSNVRE